MMIFCADKCFTVKTGMFPDQHRTFLGCDVIFELLYATEASNLLPFTYQILNPKSDSSGNAKVNAAGRVSGVESCNFGQQESYFVRSSAWAGYYAKTAWPYSAPHFPHVWKLLLVRDGSPSPFRGAVFDAVEPANIPLMRELLQRMSAAGSGRSFGGPRCVSKRLKAGCLPVKTLRIECGRVELEVTDVRQPGKRAPCDEPVRKR